MDCSEFLDRYGIDELVNQRIKFHFGNLNCCGDIVAYLGSENCVLVNIDLDEGEFVEVPLDEAYII